MITTITLADGRTVEPNSPETFRALADILYEIDKRLQGDADIVCPSLYRSQLAKLRRCIWELATDVRHIEQDAERFGSLDKALEEREYRRGMRK